MFMTGVLCTVCGAQVYFIYKEDGEDHEDLQVTCQM